MKAYLTSNLFHFSEMPDLIDLDGEPLESQAPKVDRLIPTVEMTTKYSVPVDLPKIEELGTVMGNQISYNWHINEEGMNQIREKMNEIIGAFNRLGK